MTAERARPVPDQQRGEQPPKPIRRATGDREHERGIEDPHKVERIAKAGRDNFDPNDENEG